MESTTDSSLFFASCSSNCTDYDYEHSEIRTQSEKKKRVKRSPVPKLSLSFSFMSLSDMKNTKSFKTNKASKKTQKAKSQNELLKDYCPYSSDNCGCSSGCTDCDYGLYTYTTKNKSKLKSKDKRFYIRPSSSFRPLVSQKSRKTAKPFSAINILRKKKAKLPKKKALKSSYSESSGSCNRQSNYIKHNFKTKTLKTTKDQKSKTKKKTSVRNLRKLKTMRIVKTLKLRKNKKVSKSAATIKVSERTIMKNWFPDSSNNYECNSDYTDCEKRITIKRKKLKSRSRRVKTVLFRESGDKERRQNGEATTKIRGKLARVWYDPLAQFAQAVMPISSSRKAALRAELRYANSRLNAALTNMTSKRRPYSDRAAACGVLDLSREPPYREEEEQRNETSRTNDEEEEEEKEEEEEEGGRQRQRCEEGTEPVFERSGESESQAFPQPRTARLEIPRGNAAPAGYPS
ncbi:hypothetical protein ALC53_12140 [Atta colombica]|uniref:Uncharacterized protein n=1 Tax=Atta colombica TaxID=520822 RepID=A0A151HZE6_9HYME|nr:hypothetical protein ALC53_12140 [Atta colombica]